MLKKLLLPILILLGAGAGVAAGLALQPAPEAEIEAAEMGPCGDDPNKDDHAKKDSESKESSKDEKDIRPDDISFQYVKLNNQFIIPIIRKDVVTSVAIIALSLEVESGTTDAVYAVEPRLRDAFLQALFDHASVGGFDGDFATTENLLRIRKSLKRSAKAILGTIINDVLILDIARQDN